MQGISCRGIRLWYGLSLIKVGGMNRFVNINPMPVKGWFESSFGVLSTWLTNAGYHQIPGTNTIIRETIEK